MAADGALHVWIVDRIVTNVTKRGTINHSTLTLSAEVGKEKGSVLKITSSVSPMSRSLAWCYPRIRELSYHHQHQLVHHYLLLEV